MSQSNSSALSVAQQAFLKDVSSAAVESVLSKYERVADAPTNLKPFKIVCDTSMNTKEDVEANRLKMDINMVRERG